MTEEIATRMNASHPIPNPKPQNSTNPKPLTPSPWSGAERGEAVQDPLPRSDQRSPKVVPAHKTSAIQD